MTLTVDISTLDEHGKSIPVICCTAMSIGAALRVIDGAAAAPVNQHVRRRLRREHGGEVRIGKLTAQVDVYA
jgi:hypothetical protein